MKFLLKEATDCLFPGTNSHLGIKSDALCTRAFLQTKFFNLIFNRYSVLFRVALNITYVIWGIFLRFYNDTPSEDRTHDPSFITLLFTMLHTCYERLSVRLSSEVCVLVSMVHVQRQAEKLIKPNPWVFLHEIHSLASIWRRGSTKMLLSLPKNGRTSLPFVVIC